jgi:hypothetical protein
VPDDFLARHQFRDLLRAAVKILVAVGEFRAEFIGWAVNFP